MSRLINRMYGRVFGWFESKEAGLGLKPAPSRFSRRAKLLMTPLEERVVPATFVVYNTADSGPGSLRGAILAANGSPGNDDIVFNTDPALGVDFSAGTNVIFLKSGLATSGDAGNNVTIHGPGADKLLIAPGVTASFRALLFGGLNITEVRNVTISGFSLNGAGGAIASQTTTGGLILDGVHMFGNTANTTGGAMYLNSGTHTIRNSTISGNTAVGTNGGGAIRIFGGVATNTLIIENSTFSDNISPTHGGAISISTSWVGKMTINNSTITGNSANAGTLNDGHGGGGISRFTGTTAVTVTLNSSIVADNFAANGRNDMAFTPTNLTLNATKSLIGVTDELIFNTNVDNQTGTFATPLDPRLSGLGYNGGTTPVHVPLFATPGSPAIGNGLDAANGKDQTGATRSSPFDIGSVEHVPGVPTASIGTLPNIFVGNPSPYQFTVELHDDVAINTGTVVGNNAAFRVKGPNGFNQLASYVSIDDAISGTPRFATFEFTPTGGSWDGNDNGIYTIHAEPNQIKNTGGTAIAAQMEGAFLALLPAPVPTANIPVVATLGGTEYDFTVTYTDVLGGTGIKLSSIDDNDIRVIGPGGYDVGAKLISTSLAGDGTPITATYRIIPPGGSWDVTEQGNFYTVMLQNNQVENVDGLKVSGGSLGSILVGKPQTFTVTNTNDSGTGSLRAAITAANADAVADFIVFDPTVFNSAQTIKLATGLTISEPVTITGPGANLLTITSTSTTARAILVSNAASKIEVEISNMTISGVTSTTFGAALEIQDEKVRLINMNLTNNSTTNAGGAIHANGQGSDLTIINSSITNNTASERGGALVVNFTTLGANLTVLNTTISGNSTGKIGGAMYGINWNNTLGTVTFANSTIVNNTATNIGGGIRGTSSAGVANLISTIVTNNVAFNLTGPDILNVSVNSQNSAIGTSLNYTKLSSVDDIPIGTPLLLNPLSNNGGIGLTHTFDPASPLLNKGLNPFGLTTDGRGPGFPRELATGIPDIGAVEVQVGAPVAGAPPFTLINKANAATQNPYLFTVAYMSNVDINTSTFDNSDIRVTNPDTGFDKFATFVSSSLAPNGKNIHATYKVAAPAGGWTLFDNGNYAVEVQANQVKDNSGAFVPQSTVGSFVVSIEGIITVTNTNNSGPGSLRDAVILANKGPSIDDIVFDPVVFATPQTIVLTGGQLPITESVNIIGPAARVTISGNNASRIFNINNPTDLITVNLSNLIITNGSTSDAGGAIQINNEIVNITDSEIRDSSSLANGGGIGLLAKPAQLHLLRTVVDGNIAGFNNNNGANGGGLDTGAFGALVTITDSAITNNSARNNGGGLGQAGAGGIVTITGSTISGNTAAGHSGAMYLNNLAFTLDNSTISGNVAGTFGGGINFTTMNISPVIRNSTITNNTALNDVLGGGGGFRRASGTASVTLISSIVAGNNHALTPDIAFFDVGNVQATNSLIGVTDVGNITVVGTGNLTGDSITPLDPMLDRLRDNGGLTQTHALLAGSPAIDAGTNSVPFATDQRGQPRQIGTATDIGSFERILGTPTANADPLVTIDAGNKLAQNPYVFEIRYANEAKISVASLGNDDIRVTNSKGFNQLATFLSAAPGSDDFEIIAKYQISAPVGGWTAAHNDTYSVSVESGKVASTNSKTVEPVEAANFAVAISSTFVVLNDNESGPGSLRQAILDSNLSVAPDKITFDPTFFSTPRTILLSSGEMEITDNLEIVGPGAKLLTISGEGASRIFHIYDEFRDLVVEMSGMTLKNGLATTGGGAIQFNGETLTLRNMALTNNSADSGGAIASQPQAGGSLTLINSTLSNNASLGIGGAIRMQGLARGGTFIMQQSTISGNTAGTVGGGFYGFNWNNVFTKIQVTNSTIVQNTAGNNGGGIRVSASGVPVINVESSIVAENQAPVGPDIMSGTLVTVFSAIGSPQGGTAGVGSSLFDLPIGIPLELLPLGNNGGPTQTHGFTATSPLNNAGFNPDPVNQIFDQRGPGFPRELPAGFPDIGAYERAPGVPTAVIGPLINVGVDDPSTNPYTFTVTYSEDTAINVSTLGNSNIRVTGPGGFDKLATFVTVDDNTNGSPRTATYQFTPPGGTWDFADNGKYTIFMEPNQVKSTALVAVPAGELGSFSVGFVGTYIVTNANDSGPGSLRQAILNANSAANTLDTIQFDKTFFDGSAMKTIVLQSSLPAFTDGVLIDGPGSNAATVSGEGKFRLFNFDPAPALATFVVNGLTLTNGSTIALGGAINIGNEIVTLDDVVMSNNKALEGGAINVQTATASLTIDNSRMVNNTATEDGGAINVNGAAPITIRTSTMSGNVAGSDGGGIYFISGGSFILERSTVSGNTANGSGGTFNLGGAGIYFFGVIGPSGFRIQNSTVSGNVHTSLPGGGIALANFTGTAQIFNSTIVNNTATGGGGIARVGAIGSGTLTIQSTVVSGNSATSTNTHDLSFGTGVITATFSAVGTDPLGSVNDYGNPANNNLSLGTNPLLGPLANNGGPTLTHAVLNGSPLVNAGDNSFPLFPDVDQIGNPRVFGASADIGAVERQAASTPVVTSFVVNNGAAQRSRLTTITINFSSPVDVSQFQALGSITLTRTAATPSGTVGTLVQTGAVGANGRINVAPASGNFSSITLTFDNANAANETAGVEYGSLSDGRWQLAVPSFGFTSTLNDPALRRLFGDFEVGPPPISNGTVDSSDFGSFGSAFGTSPGVGVSPFDYDNNGTIDSTDFAAFGSRFGVSI